VRIKTPWCSKMKAGREGWTAAALKLRLLVTGF